MIKRIGIEFGNWEGRSGWMVQGGKERGGQIIGE